jgi:hypothetical protein
MNNLEWWQPCHLMFLAMADSLTPKQQQKIQATLHKLAEQRGEQGDVVASHFCHALAGDEYVERPKPQLRLVK